MPDSRTCSEVHRAWKDREADRAKTRPKSGANALGALSSSSQKHRKGEMHLSSSPTADPSQAEIFPPRTTPSAGSKRPALLIALFKLNHRPRDLVADDREGEPLVTLRALPP